MPTAVVTGANSGIANAFAKVLLDEVSLMYTILLAQASYNPRATKCTPSTEILEKASLDSRALR